MSRASPGDDHTGDTSSTPGQITEAEPTVSGSSGPGILDAAAILSAECCGLPPTVGRYEIAGEIARGGMGVIAKAWDPQIGRFVALKLLHEHFQTDDDLIERFHAEARISGRLDHPAIVPVHELGRCEDGRPYFAMRLLEGRTLSKLLADRDSLDSRQVMMLRIFEKICEGVAYGHTQGVIHRDLKPSNVIVGQFGVVHVMDWGLAKYVRHSEESPALRLCRDAASPGECTVCGSIIGTPAYLPPEQARGEIERIDERSDVFCLGGILCHILTGSAPFTGSESEKIQQAVNAQLAPAFYRLDTSPAEREVAELAKRCLAPDPAERPSDANEVAAAITGYLESDLRRAERDLVRFFELSLDLFCIAGLDGHFRRINANFSTLLGYPEEEMLSRPFVDFIHPEDLQPTAEAMACLSEGRPVVQFTNRYLHANGSYVYLEWVAKTETDSGGNIYAVARDVTERMNQQLAAERALHKLREMEQITTSP